MSRPAILFNNGEAFVDGARYGTAKYEQNITRKQDFLVPIMLPVDMTVEEVIVSLNGGKQRFLKSGAADIDIDGVKVPHQQLSKRR